MCMCVRACVRACVCVCVCAYGMHVCLSLGFCMCVFVVLFPLSCFVRVVAVPVRIFKGV